MMFLFFVTGKAMAMTGFGLIGISTLFESFAVR